MQASSAERYRHSDQDQTEAHEAQARPPLIEVDILRPMVADYKQQSYDQKIRNAECLHRMILSRSEMAAGKAAQSAVQNS